MKRFRQRIGQLEKQGVHSRQYDAPLSDELIKRLHEVSDEWLQLPGKRERTFTLGRFEPAYLRTTQVFTAEDINGRILAFVNLPASYHQGEVTIDLMRHRLRSPNGIMDYLFIKLFLLCKAQGFTRFNLGMAPMAGFQEREEASVAEKAVHSFFQRLNFLFSFNGLKAYKAKFADSWEPRYVVYRNVFDLPKLGVALSRVSEVVDKR
jgi:phosphatidylglycerol lysyltransferase